MKKIFQKLTFLAVPFMAIGCTGPAKSSSNNGTSSNPSTSANPSIISSTVSNTSGVHVHEWATEWSSDQNNHWHA